MLKTLKAVGADIVRYVWPLTKKWNLIRAIGILILVIAAAYVLSGDVEVPTEAESDSTPIVFVGSTNDLAATNDASFVGTVRAVSEAQIQAERGGRVTAVNVTAGDTVSAGAIIATLENASEQAAVLQAQGSYESALAAAAQSDVSVEDAENTVRSAQNTAISTYRNAYTTVNGVVLNTIDQFYGNPQSQLPGVRIDSQGNTRTLNEARVALQSTLVEWQATSLQLNSDSNLPAALAAAEQNTNDSISILDILIAATSNADASDTLAGAPVTSYTAELNAARATLNGTVSSLQGADTGLSTAEEALRRAQIGSTQSAELSAANAQVKSALGSLRSAQANLAKTILRSPIAGTVNSVQINTGDFLAAFTPVAEVANNDALEISIFLGESDLQQITVGDEVVIEGSQAGVITNIAPAVDPITLKTEVKVATESTELTNGDTVTIQLSARTIVQNENTPMLVPITAVKFSATNGSMFTVENGTLTARPVEIGPIIGSFVTITSGIDRSTEFVLDARGLAAGQAVEAVTQ